MTITLNCHRTSADGPWECSFHAPATAAESQKATAFIGHPADRRAAPIRRAWKVRMPEAASLQDDAVIWFDADNFRTLTANEVFDYAQRQVHGFSLDG